MASTLNLIGPKIHPRDSHTIIAAADLVEGFIKKGADDDHAVQIATTDNEAAIGYIDVPYLTDELVSYRRLGSEVLCVCDGTVAVGDEVVSGNGVNKVQSVANLAPADNAVINILGTCIAGNTDGKTCKIKLNIRTARY